MDQTQVFPLINIVVLSLLAGLGISLGGLLAYHEATKLFWQKSEIRQFIVAIGGGILLAAVALVLIPEGLKHISTFGIIIYFLSGGVIFFLLDKLLLRKGGAFPMLLATILDFIPESMAIGATYLRSPKLSMFLAVIIALQNIPEGFNAFIELHETKRLNSKRYLALFILLSLFGPLAAVIGYVFLSTHLEVLSGIMLFSAAGIVYLIFEDIAPETKSAGQWAPAFGAVIGFLIGLICQHLIM
jgi:zinc transporter, ZIP family